MKKTVGKWKRFVLALTQHAMAAGMMAAAAWLLLNSYVAVDSFDGTQIYELFPINVKQRFEESEIYRDLFRNAVSDITQLVVIRGQLETDGVFDPAKKIDVTKYAREIGVDPNCMVTAVYNLDDIIKWGKNSVEYKDRFLSLSEFVNYFGNCLYPENYAINEYGQLVFDGFYRVGDSAGEAGADVAAGSADKTAEELAQISGQMKEYTEKQLEDIVFSYLMMENLRGVTLSREDDGSLTVRVPLLLCRYATVDGERQLTAYADNWLDYMQLQNNLAVAVKTLTENYQRYQVFNDAYSEKNTNVKYMVRMMTEDGLRSCTNVTGLKGYGEKELTEFFGQYRRHLIYYPGSLVFMGNTILSEEELDDYLGVYGSAYPDTTHIWLGLDSDYTVETDVFYQAHVLYERIVPNVNRMLALVLVLMFIWLGICVYLTVTAGAYVGADGSRGRQLNRFDRIWTELLILLGAGLVYGGLLGGRLLIGIAATAGVVPREMLGIQLTSFYRYGSFIIFGMYVSIFFDVVWYSLIRRIKGGNLWRDSLLRHLVHELGSGVKFVLRHRNSAVSMLLPYNLFLFANLAGVVAVYQLRDVPWRMALSLVALVALDGVVGVLLFRRNAEQLEIVEGINRIRDGEVDFKLDTDGLHGSSRELADAVNNIGEGIRKAVRTSMKDEQLKTDLITNVSHDLKTPLTSIINYVDLLKRLDIAEEPARGYIEILNGKAQRLKQLTDDLVEASKISSGNIELEREVLDLTELMQQGIGEFSEKFEACHLQVIFEDGGKSAYVYADGRRMWRVVENLFNNMCKYAMDGTRIYIDIAEREGRVEAVLKNISRQQMNISPEELTERFIRGDSSRSMEGSGLGLSIAKSLVQVQGGAFEIVLDGDLFKVLISFPAHSQPNTQAG